jgi:hypothetical protein
MEAAGGPLVQRIFPIQMRTLLSGYKLNKFSYLAGHGKSFPESIF